MSDNIISFFDCAPVLREAPLSVTPAVVEETIITVEETAQTAYKYMERAARRLTRWITVSADWFRRTAVRTFCTCFRNIIRMTGVQILRQSMILRF